MTDVLSLEMPTCLPDSDTLLSPSTLSPSPSPSSPSSSSQLERPFKILVQKETFLIDSESLRRMSPIFSIMCFGKDFENGRELSREIVDEKSEDVDVFLRAIQDNKLINVRNFSTVLRLGRKYQVSQLIEACENFVESTNLSRMKADEVLTLLLACNEFHVSRSPVVALVRRLADEEKPTFNRLKLSRFLPAQLYGAVIGTNLNLGQLREVEGMNGHYLKMERNRIRWRRDVCDECKAVLDAAKCDGCHRTLCKRDSQKCSCPSGYGTRMLIELRKNIVELEWE